MMPSNYYIDFLGTAERLVPNIPRKDKRAYKKSDAYDIVLMTEGVMYRHYITIDVIRVIRRCIEYRIQHAKYTPYLGPFPLKPKTIGPLNKGAVEFISMSLIMNIMMYMEVLDRERSGLPGWSGGYWIIMDKIMLGFEWVLCWERRGNSIYKDENDYISVFKSEDVISMCKSKFLDANDALKLSEICL